MVAAATNQDIIGLSTPLDQESISTEVVRSAEAIVCARPGRKPLFQILPRRGQEFISHPKPHLPAFDGGRQGGGDFEPLGQGGLHLIRPGRSGSDPKHRPAGGAAYQFQRHAQPPAERLPPTEPHPKVQRGADASDPARHEGSHHRRQGAFEASGAPRGAERPGARINSWPWPRAIWSFFGGGSPICWI